MKPVRIIFPEHEVKRNPPANLQTGDDQLFKGAYSIRLKAVTLSTLKNISVLRQSLFSFAKLRFYISHSHILTVTRAKRLKSLLRYFKWPKIIESGIWITDEWSSEYFHWFTDAVTRLLSADNLTSTNPVLLPVSYETIDYIKESLSILGVKTVYYDSSAHVLVKNLIIPGHTAPTGNYNESVISNLRSRFLTWNKEPPQKKIYISRKKANKRNIINEAEVIQLVETLGFEIHLFEDYAFKKQIEILGRTKTIIGLHGAGLTNMIFMNEGGNILELRNRNDAHNNCFFSLASALKHKYFYLICNGTIPDTYKADFLVDIKKLKSTIENIEVH